MVLAGFITTVTIRLTCARGFNLCNGIKTEIGQINKESYKNKIFEESCEARIENKNKSVLRENYF